jgi:hypothetical protein
LEPTATSASDRDECEVGVYSQAKKRVVASKAERVTAELSVVLRVYQRSNVALMLRSISLA